MVAVSYPGVYVEEIPSGAKVIQAAGTSTAAFFGVAEKGPIGKMEKIFSFAQYQEKYGGYVNGYYLAHSVYQFFNNGGTQCYIGRVAPGAETADISLFDQGSSAQTSMTISAISAGIWANKLQLAMPSRQLPIATSSISPYTRKTIQVRQMRPRWKRSATCP